MDDLLESMYILLALCAIIGLVAFVGSLFEKKNIRINPKPIIIGVVVFLLVGLVVSCTVVSNEPKGGDGKSTCRNCGRSTSLVPGYGYCSNCYESFRDWQNKD